MRVPFFPWDFYRPLFPFSFAPFTFFTVRTGAHPRPPLLLATLLLSASASAIDISSTPLLPGAILFMSLRHGVDMPLISMSQPWSSVRVVHKDHTCWLPMRSSIIISTSFIAFSHSIPCVVGRKFEVYEV